MEDDEKDVLDLEARDGTVKVSIETEGGESGDRPIEMLLHFTKRWLSWIEQCVRSKCTTLV